MEATGVCLLLYSNHSPATYQNCYLSVATVDSSSGSALKVSRAWLSLSGVTVPRFMGGSFPYNLSVLISFPPQQGNS
jgi:hypothetical protein